MTYKILSVDKQPANLRLFENGVQTDSVSSKSQHAGARARRISMYATAIGQRLGLTAEEIEQLSLAAFFHGLKLSDSVVRKGNLPADGEWRIAEFNNERTALLPARVTDTLEADNVLRHIRERFDGGYADRLSGSQIPLHSRIITVAQAYDEITSIPNVNQLHSHNEAIAQLKKGASTLFDPAIVAKFCEIEPIGQIRQLISQGFSGIRRFSVRIFCDPGSVSLAQMLDKIKTTPMLAMETLYIANRLNPQSPTAQLMVAANKLGEAGLQHLLKYYGFPLGDPQMRIRAESALRRATAAQVLAAYTDLINPDIAYTLGLLQDVGEILLSALFPKEMSDLKQIDDDNARFYREVGLFGVECAQVSQWMLGACGISPNLTAAINTRHKSMRLNTPVSLLMDVARRIAEAGEESKASVVDSLCKVELATLRLSRNDLDRICDRSTAISKELIKSHEEIYEFVEKALI